jgi:hypothetical protein
MDHKLFSELIAKLRIRPDLALAKMVDDINLPYRNIKAVKKDINNLFLRVFSDFMSEYEKYSGDFMNFEVQYDSSISMFVEFGQKYELTMKKVKKTCPNLLSPPSVSANDTVLTDDFMMEMDRTHILMALVMGATFRKTVSHIENEIGIETLQPKIVYDQIFEFWTKYYKNDFCYLSKMEFDYAVKAEESEIELCLLRFFFNAYLKAFVDFDRYEGDRLKIIQSIVSDTTNYKWYVIFGFWLVKRFEEMHVNILDVTSSDFKKVEEILEESFS